MTAAVVALGVVVALLGILVVGLLRSHADILRALHDLGVNLEDGPGAATSRPAHSSPPTRTAPGVARPRPDGPLGKGADLTGTMPQGGAARVAVVGVEHRTLLAFLSTGCGTCGVFWEALASDDVEAEPLPGPPTRVVVVTNGPGSESPAAVADLAPANLVTVMSDEAWDDYDVPVSPYFVLVDGPSGAVVGEGAGTSWPQVVDLLGKAVADADVLAPPSGSAARPERMRGAERAERIDAELRAAGIEPGDPSLYPTGEARP